MKKAADITEMINNLGFDIKAEALIADLMDNGLMADEFIMVPSGGFKRRFSADIKKAEVTRTESGFPLLAISLNRDGIYDSLPEGLFHAAPEKPPKDSSEMSLESKKLRQEEKEARTFFLPFENEIFLQRIGLEQCERRILRKFSDTLFDEISPEFWNFDKSLDPHFISKLILLLHHAHRIAGNNNLTARCLELIIEEKVTIITTPPGNKKNIEMNTGKLNGCQLGSAALGTSFICGSDFDDLMPSMEVQIGPLKKNSIRGFLEDGNVTRFLDCFYGYFIPAEMNAKTVVITDKYRQCFILNHVDTEPILGFNTAI